MGARREGREVALQVLYSHDFKSADVSGAMTLSAEDIRLSSSVRNFADELVRGVLDNLQIIDARIVEKSKNWSLSRMSRVDLNILRMAVYELLYRSDIPKNVTINEAIEVAKKFGTEDSPSFVNGILDEVSSTLPDKE